MQSRPQGHKGQQVPGERKSTWDCVVGMTPAISICRELKRQRKIEVSVGRCKFKDEGSCLNKETGNVV